MFLQFWHLWNTQRLFFGCNCVVGMLKIHGITMFFDFCLYISEICHFLCYLWCDFLWYKFFFIFQDSVWLITSFWCVYCCSIHRFYWLSDRCWSRFALWWFLSEKCCHRLVVSTGFWSWLLNVSSVLTTLKYTATLFSVVNAFWVCWRFMGVLGFDFGVLVSEICLFLCVYPWCDFSW